jgi:aminoglycoside N3'-acetyltransferase
MKIKLYNDFERILKYLTDKQDKIVVFQTRFYDIFAKYDLSADQICKILLDMIFKNFYDKTILFPAFSDDIIKFKRYDLAKSIPNTGVFPKYCLKTKKFKRTLYPLHSFLVKGIKSNEILRLDQITTWGKGSVFEWLEVNNARWVALNLNWSNGCAFGHRSEEIAKVPYRYYKTYEGKIFNNNIFIKNIIEKKYSNYLDANIEFKYDAFDEAMLNNEEIFFPNKVMRVKTALTKDITKNLVNLLLENPYAFIKNYKVVENWLKINKVLK